MVLYSAAFNFNLGSAVVLNIKLIKAFEQWLEVRLKYGLSSSLSTYCDSMVFETRSSMHLEVKTCHRFIHCLIEY